MLGFSYLNFWKHDGIYIYINKEKIFIMLFFIKIDISIIKLKNSLLFSKLYNYIHPV